MLVAGMLAKGILKIAVTTSCETDALRRELDLLTSELKSAEITPCIRQSSLAFLDELERRIARLSRKSEGLDGERQQ